MTDTVPSSASSDASLSPCHPLTLSPGHETKPKRRALIAILLILALASALRLAKLDTVLPGFQVDDASNVWNAWCLLHTGHDEWGKAWPLFYTRAFDDNRSPLLVYFLIPFEAIGGMSLYATRLPCALGGIATVALVYYIGRRMFDTPTGLLAALFLALDPAHIEYTQRAHEACITPLLFAAPLAALLWAGAPFSAVPHAARWMRAFLAGLLTGLGCYGYAALRIIIPASFALAVLVSWKEWPGQSRRWTIALCSGFLLLFGPLVYVSLTDPNINSRARSSMVWTQDDPIATRAQEVFDRYIQHFGYEYLFTNGGKHENYALPPGFGALNLYLAPALALGLLSAIIGAWRGSISCRVLLALLVVYPAADILFRADGVNSFRCFPGVVPLTLICAVGISKAWQWSAARMMSLAIAGAVIYIPFIVIGVIGFFSALLTASTNPQRLLSSQYDIMLACERYAPQIARADLVFVTSYGTVYPYIQTLVNLRYDPVHWQNVSREYKLGPPPYTAVHVCMAYDKFRFLHFPQDAIAELQIDKTQGRLEHVVMLLRPHERELALGHQPIGAIEFGGQTWLLVYEFDN